jgi:hypothetical protein
MPSAQSQRSSGFSFDFSISLRSLRAFSFPHERFTSFTFVSSFASNKIGCFSVANVLSS